MVCPRCGRTVPLLASRCPMCGQGLPKFSGVLTPPPADSATEAVPLGNPPSMFPDSDDTTGLSRSSASAFAGGDHEQTKVSDRASFARGGPPRGGSAVGRAWAQAALPEVGQSFGTRYHIIRLLGMG